MEKIFAWIKGHWSLIAIIALALALLFAIPSGCTANRDLVDARRALKSATDGAAKLQSKLDLVIATARDGEIASSNIIKTATRYSDSTDRAIVLLAGINKQIKILESIYNTVKP